MTLPVTAIIVTKNEERNISRCLETLNQFSDVIVVDSTSTDRTLEIAQQFPNVRTINFEWNGQYPKKRQWCLDHIETKYDWIFFIDADEALTFAAQQEISRLNLKANATHAGFFIKGQYVVHDRPLKFGLKNNKCMLIHKRRMCFPVINDLDIEGMGEIEGHYQPVKTEASKNLKIGQLKAPILHHAYEDEAAWQTRHRCYANWQRKVNERAALPKDPSRIRAALKHLFFALPLKGWIAFIHCYVIKGGFIDGRAGFDFARSRKYYYDLMRLDA